MRNNLTNNPQNNVASAPLAKIGLLGTRDTAHVAVPVKHYAELQTSTKRQEEELGRLRRALAVCQTTITCIVALPHGQAAEEVFALSRVMGMAIRAASTEDIAQLPDSQREHFLSLAEREADAAGARVAARFTPAPAIQHRCADPECGGLLRPEQFTTASGTVWGRRCQRCGYATQTGGMDK